jgi:uncharacterized protein (TIGR03000 family)
MLPFSEGSVMNRKTILFALTLAAGALTVLPATAQPPGVYYPYYESAPMGYPASGASLPIPPPAWAPRDAFRPSGPAFGNVGVGAYGGMAGPFYYLNDARGPVGRPTLPADNRARIWLTVPADAQVWIGGDPTKQTGEYRHFVSPPLASGRSYTYDVRVRWMKDGKPVEEERRVSVRAGASSWVDIPPAADANSAEAPQAFGMMRFPVPK